MNFPFEVYTDIKSALPLLELVRYFSEKGDGCLKMYNSTLMKRFNVRSERTIQSWINKLKKYNLIRVVLTANKYRQIYFNNVAEKSLNCGVNAGSNNEVYQSPQKNVCVVANDSKMISESELENLTQTYGTELIEESKNEMATRKISNPLAYLKTMLERKHAKRQRQATRKTKTPVIRTEQTSEWFKEYEVSEKEQVPSYLQSAVVCHAPNSQTPSESSVKTSDNMINLSDEEKVAQMKANQEAFFASWRKEN